MATNHIQQLAAGQGCYTFFLNAQGRILADALLLAFENHFLLDTEPERRGFLYEHLDRYIIADDVTLEDVTDATSCIAVEGPSAAEALGRAGAPVPDAAWSHSNWGDRTVARASATGEPGFRIYASAGSRGQVVQELEDAGAAAASAEDARIVRLEMGVPRYGEDFSDKHLPHETQLLEAVHFNKGCYLGQEIVERVRSRGGVHRFLVPLALGTHEAPPPGTKILAGGKEAGEITSAAYSPALDRVAALGYVRLGEIPAGTPLEAGGVPVEIRTKPRERTVS